ncbi:unnamed protein product, partial [Rotaria sp. Silwood1]
ADGTDSYRDTFQILRRLVGSDAFIMSRPVDMDLNYVLYAWK